MIGRYCTCDRKNSNAGAGNYTGADMQITALEGSAGEFPEGCVLDRPGPCEHRMAKAGYDVAGSEAAEAASSVEEWMTNISYLKKYICLIKICADNCASLSG